LPEGHTIHRLARDLQRNLEYQPLRVSSLQERFTAGAARLDGLSLMVTEAHGKHLFVMFFGRPRHPARTTGSAVVREDLHVHLGLYGSFVIGQGPAPEPRADPPNARRSPAAGATSRGATACELVTSDEVTAIHHRLGPDPLRWTHSPDAA
jgi:endonuclease-8